MPLSPMPVSPGRGPGCRGRCKGRLGGRREYCGRAWRSSAGTRTHTPGACSPALKTGPLLLCWKSCSADAECWARAAQDVSHQFHHALYLLVPKLPAEGMGVYPLLHLPPAAVSVCPASLLRRVLIDRWIDIDKISLIHCSGRRVPRAPVRWREGCPAGHGAGSALRGW